VHAVDILQWNVNSLRTRIPELDIMRRRYAPAAVCLQETHLHPTHNTSLRGSYQYEHEAGDKVNGGTAVFV
jgi:exonuclease III